MSDYNSKYATYTNRCRSVWWRALLDENITQTRHDTRNIAVKYFTPYLTKRKNDLSDAVTIAISEAFRELTARYVP